jgi:hypothetical protein
MKKLPWKDIFKFLSGAFFVTAGASWYIAYYKISMPFMGGSMSPDFLFVRGFMHFGLFLVTFYFGFLRSGKGLKK